MAQSRVNISPTIIRTLLLVTLSSVAHPCCPAQMSHVEKLIYHQTMTPLWLEAHASYIDSSRTATAKQLTFNAGSVNNAALLKVFMIPAGVLKDSTPLTVDITVAHDVSIGGGGTDSDIRYGVSDGTRFIGFETCDKGNYGTNAPCYGMEGVSGSAITSIQHDSVTPKPTDSFYPGQYVFTLKLDERWGSCFTAHDGGYAKIIGYNNRLMFSKGLTLEVYKSDKGERVGIKYIKGAIKQDA
ncbi:uncharacterized protein LOC144664868 isoform X1 [Oculina patagonica]